MKICYTLLLMQQNIFTVKSSFYIPMNIKPIHQRNVQVTAFHLSDSFYFAILPQTRFQTRVKNLIIKQLKP